MAKNNQQESWLLLSVFAVVVVFALFFVFLFPDDSVNFLSQYVYVIMPFILIVLVVVVGFVSYKKIAQSRALKIQENRNRQIKMVEQLIWRGRYSLESQKDQILIEDTPETRAKWQSVKQEFIRTKIFPVVPESDVPMNLASTLIENALSGGRYSTGRLPTYRVQDLQ